MHSHKIQIVWKHGPDWPFYALMLRTKKHQNPFFFTGHQNVNKPKSSAPRTVYRLIFLPFYKSIVSFFSFFCQDANKTRSNCAIIGCNLSKKHKLTLCKTQNGESNYVDHKFFFNIYLPGATYLYETLGADIQILQSWLIGWSIYCVTLRLHDIKKLTSASLEYTMEVHLLLMPIFYLSGESRPSIFPLQFGELFIFIFVIHVTKSKLITRSAPVLTLPEKLHYSLFQGYKSVIKKSKYLQKIQAEKYLH